MEGLTLVKPCTLLIAVATGIFCADVIQWGTVESDFQLGIGATSASELALRISLKNVGAEAREVPIGFEGAAGSVYNVKFTAHALREHEQIVFDLNALNAHPTGLMLSTVCVWNRAEFRRSHSP